MIKLVGKNKITVTVIKDSIASNGHRMLTLELEYPRFIHSEFMTHRMLSKNASSSRAVPLSRAIQHVCDNPALPVHWGAAQSGMQASNELSGTSLAQAQSTWFAGIRAVTDLVGKFETLGVHKQIAARWLEPCQMIKVVATGTEWDNLLWLRNDEAAQPEFRELARLIQSCRDYSIPQHLNGGEWHTPYVNTVRRDSGELVYLDSADEVLVLDDALKISASCAAQVSYRRLDDTKEKALVIFGKLFSGPKPHMSPVEHIGTPIVYDTPTNQAFDPLTWENGVTHVTRGGTLCSGNLQGWIQYRQTLPNNVFQK